MKTQYLTVKQASLWASQFLGKQVSTSNISYLLQYGRIRKIDANGAPQVLKSELENYYQALKQSRKNSWKEKLGSDLNWKLSFDNLKESQTTKHIHRLHPYKGKFIPQLVEYFLDEHTDEFKTQKFFSSGDIVLDPFCGSGTTLAQANELGIHALGIDISSFNAFISNCKIAPYDTASLKCDIEKITLKLSQSGSFLKSIQFENELADELKNFNDEYFPAGDYKYKRSQKLINEEEYGGGKENKFLPVYKALIEKYGIKLLAQNPKGFIESWYIENIIHELNFVFDQIKKVENPDNKKILSLILSRTMRSCRATSHADLATLIKPITKTYYCSKHGKICKPVFSIMKWWKRYAQDAIARIKTFETVRTKTYQYCLTGDSRTMDISAQIEKKNKDFAQIIERRKIAGIFSSPPYVGLIDYHEQHAYAYDLFGFTRRDELEIGPLSKGQTIQAKADYVDGISKVLNNVKKYLKPDYNVFFVANDKHNLYPEIARNADMKIVNRFKRPVLNRSEKDKGAYCEIIFHLKGG
jgi:hypothetical protein